MPTQCRMCYRCGTMSYWRKKHCLNLWCPRNRHAGLLDPKDHGISIDLVPTDHLVSKDYSGYDGGYSGEHVYDVDYAGYDGGGHHDYDGGGHYGYDSGYSGDPDGDGWDSGYSKRHSEYHDPQPEPSQRGRTRKREDDAGEVAATKHAKTTVGSNSAKEDADNGIAADGGNGKNEQCERMARLKTLQQNYTQEELIEAALSCIAGT